MKNLQREAELAVGKVGMGDVERAGTEPRRQDEASSEELKEIALAAEDQRALAGIDGERHADPAADIFLKAGRAGEALGGMNDLREAVAARPAVRSAYSKGAALNTGYERNEKGVTLFPWEGLLKHVIVV